MEDLRVNIYFQDKLTLEFMLLYSLNIPPTPSDINFFFLGCTSEGVLLLLAHFEGTGKKKNLIYAHQPSQLLCRESVLV